MKRDGRANGERGYAMAALLVGMSVMAVMLSAAMPVWSTAAKRLKEDELVFRGEQYAHAIALYQRKYANALPPSIDVLVNERFLRKKYLDPITGQEFQVLTGAVGEAAPGMGAGGRGAPAGQTGRGGSAATGSGATEASLNELAGRTGGLGTGRSSFGATTSRGSTGLGGASGTGGGIAASGRIGITPRAGGGGTVGPVGGAGGIVGVASKSKEKSLRLYNGRDVYSEWTFVPVQRQLQAGGGEGQAAPGMSGGRGQSTPGQQNQGTRGTSGSRFGSGADSSGQGAGGGLRRGGSTSPFGR